MYKIFFIPKFIKKAIDSQQVTMEYFVNYLIRSNKVPNSVSMSKYDVDLLRIMNSCITLNSYLSAGLNNKTAVPKHPLLDGGIYSNTLTSPLYEERGEDSLLELKNLHILQEVEYTLFIVVVDDKYSKALANNAPTVFRDTMLFIGNHALRYSTFNRNKQFIRDIIKMALF